MDEEKTETVVEYLYWNALHGDEYSRGPRDYAAYLLLTGQLAAKVDELRKSTTKEDPSGIRLLARLLQVQGQLDEAIVLAKATDDPQLQADLFYRAEDWAALCENDLTPGDDGPENLGFSAAFHRLADNQEGFAEAIAGLIADVDKNPDNAYFCLEALMINDRWPQALQLMQKDERQRGEMLRLLAFQLRPGDGFRQVGLDQPSTKAAEWFQEQTHQVKRKTPQGQTIFYRGMAVVRTLDELGERDAARRLLIELDKFASDDEQRTILELELKLGLREQAWQRAARVAQKPELALSVCYALFPERSREAHPWWQALRQIAPQEETRATLDRLAKLLQPDPDPELKALAEKAAEQARSLKPQEAAERFRAIAEICASKREFALARAYFAEQATHAKQVRMDPSWDKPLHVVPLVRIGDMDAAKKDWMSAAQAYYEAWKTSKTNPVPLYLRGRALVQAGHEKEGRAAIERAVLLPLGDAERRRELAEAMQERGLQAEANKQWELILLLGAFEGWEGSEDWAVEEACQQLGNQLESTDPGRAAQLWQRLLFYCLKTNAALGEIVNYADVVGQIHRGKALGLLNKGKTAEALREIELAKAAHPGQIELVEQAVPKLIAAGERPAADKLFVDAFKVYDGVCRTFPNSARHHNDLAWLCARCDRRLDEALTHASRAVELAPEQVAYLDALAEVHFRQGNREQALRVARQAQELEPTNPHLQAQVDRFGGR